MAKPLIYDRGFHGNIIGDIDTEIKDKIISQLTEDYVFVNTTWIEQDRDLEKIVSKEKIAVCYSGPDWENFNCIPLRRNAHRYIKENSKEVFYIGNTKGRYYFNYWAEFIRRNPEGFFDDRYLEEPQFDKVYMCLNRKPHDHRVFLVDKFREHDILDSGIVSLGIENSLVIEESLSEIVELGEAAVHGKMDIKNDIVTLGDYKNWNRHFINVVTETTIHTDVFISEKTWKPIIGLRPFVILGDYNIYIQLKELGFDTFDDVFGTWWDNGNWEERANGIVSVLKNIDLDQCSLIYKNIFSRLLKNRERFLEYIQENYKRIGSLL
jgi:hypothetical protein